MAKSLGLLKTMITALLLRDFLISQSYWWLPRTNRAAGCLTKKQTAHLSWNGWYLCKTSLISSGQDADSVFINPLRRRWCYVLSLLLKRGLANLPLIISGQNECQNRNGSGAIYSQASQWWKKLQAGDHTDFQRSRTKYPRHPAEG
jgi:hypothetical protein